MRRSAGSVSPPRIRCAASLSTSRTRSERNMSALPQDQTIAITLNGRGVEAFAGETLIQTAKRHGIDIPHLCYMEGMRADGNCRACVVEVKGERVLAASCCRPPQPGMEVATDSPRARHSQKIVVELLQADMPGRDYKPDSEL